MLIFSFYMKNLSLRTTKVSELRELDQDGGVLNEIVQLFFTTTEAKCKELDVALLGQDFEHVRAIAHELRSSCGNLGGDVMADLARQLEDLPQLPGVGHENLVKQLAQEFLVVKDLLTLELAKT